ncbi:unnamed protein product [Echinostoma caproni]|uniref:Transmembrane protein n=1 Tax=Echinostoma caproni TaxID=27848 RepID=A0A183AH27_9TREM|nr:unnamed protein product [Echinostoma caproni]
MLLKRRHLSKVPLTVLPACDWSFTVTSQRMQSSRSKITCLMMGIIGITCTLAPLWQRSDEFAFGAAARFSGRQTSFVVRGSMIVMLLQFFIYLAAVVLVIVGMMLDWEDSDLGILMSMIGTFASFLSTVSYATRKNVSSQSQRVYVPEDCEWLFGSIIAGLATVVNSVTITTSTTTTTTSTEEETDTKIGVTSSNPGDEEGQIRIH